MVVYRHRKFYSEQRIVTNLKKSKAKYKYVPSRANGGSSNRGDSKCRALLRVKLPPNYDVLGSPTVEV